MTAVSSPHFVRSISDSLNLPLGQGDAVQTLNNGNAFLESFINDIDGARSSINIMVYIWTDGRMSDQVIEHLSRKVREGVQVRIIIDSFGSNWWERPKAKLKSLEQAGAKVEIFRSLTIAPWDFLKNHLRNHRRAMVIDGDIGYFGGMAISDPWLGDAGNSKEIRDMMFRVTGPMAHQLQGVFSELWASTAGEILLGDRFFAPLPATKGNGSLTYVSLPSTPTPDTLTLQRFVLLSLAAAEKNIYITSPYFLPDLSLREILIRKAKEGVDVRVLVPNHLNDSWAVHHASRDSYDELLAGGVRIQEYQPTFIHAKSIVIDGEEPYQRWSFCGLGFRVIAHSCGALPQPTHNLSCSLANHSRSIHWVTHVSILRFVYFVRYGSRRRHGKSFLTFLKALVGCGHVSGLLMRRVWPSGSRMSSPFARRSR